MSKLISWLFTTDALRVCPEGEPFWYTSGTIGPFYVNTHFLSGSERRANEILAVMDDSLKTRNMKIVEKTLDEAMKVEPIYRQLIDILCDAISEKIGAGNIDFISGGERRDWFFSIPAAKKLQIPHITLFKDMTTQLPDKIEISGKKVLHIADLINEASSYERAWEPIIKKMGAQLLWSFAIIDRKQGGGAVMQRLGIQNNALVSIDKNIFETAERDGILTSAQTQMIYAYLNDPYEAMRNFLVNNPDFLEKELQKGGKNAERAKLCIEKNWYEL